MCLIFLTDDSYCCQTLYWRSYSCKNVPSSVLGGHPLAIADPFDMLLSIKFDLQVFCNHVIPISMGTYYLALFDFCTCMCITTESPLKIDLLSAQKLYSKRGITDVSLIFYKKRFAALWKKIKSESSLNTVLPACHLEHPMQQKVTDEEIRYDSVIRKVVCRDVT